MSVTERLIQTLSPFFKLIRKLVYDILENGYVEYLQYSGVVDPACDPPHRAEQWLCHLHQRLQVDYCCSSNLTCDSRVRVTNSPGTEDWVLAVDMARRSDRGPYECQVRRGLDFATFQAEFIFTKVTISQW